MREVAATWLARRRVGAAVVAMAACTVLGLALPATMQTPQLRGAPLTAAPQTAVALLLVLCLLPTLASPDDLLEQRSPRAVARARAGLGLGLLVTAGLLVTVVAGASGGTALDAAAAARTVVVTGAAALLATRLGGVPAGVATVLAYAGACLFAGVAPDGRVEPWAVVVAPVSSPADAVLAGLALTGAVAVFAVPRRAQGAGPGRWFGGPVVLRLMVDGSASGDA